MGQQCNYKCNYRCNYISVLKRIYKCKVKTCMYTISAFKVKVKVKVSLFVT